MAPTSCRHTLIWSLPTLAILLTFLWYKSRRGSSRSDPGGTAKGTRKAKKQEQRITRTSSSLLAESSEVPVKKSSCSTLQEEVVIAQCPPATVTVGKKSDQLEAQGSELNSVVNCFQQSTAESAVSSSETDSSSDSTNNYFEGKSRKDCQVETLENCGDSTEQKDQQIRLCDNSSGHSGVENSASSSNLFAEEISAIANNFSDHLIEGEGTAEQLGAVQETDYKVSVPHETIKEIGILRQTKQKISVNETKSNVVVPKEANLEITDHTERNFEITFANDTYSDAEVTVQEGTNSEITIPQKTIPELSVIPQTNTVTIVLQETNSEVSVQQQTKLEDPIQWETKSNISALQDTDSEIANPKETISEVAVPQETNREKENNSEISLPQKTLSDSTITQEIICDVGAPQEVIPEIAVPLEVHCDIAVPQETDTEYIVGKNSNINSSESVEDNFTISKCAEPNCMLFTNTLPGNSETDVSCVECCSTEDLTSVTVLPAENTILSCNTEEGTMPEFVRDMYTLENSDVHTESVPEIKRSDINQASGVDSSSRNKDSEGTQPTRISTPPLGKEVSEVMDVAATSSSCGLEGKLAALELGKGRDSANHSPAEVMLASPSASSYSDEGSSDSGKGCSDLATPPSRTPASGSSVSGDATALSVYEFVLPQHLVGRLIGRHGAFVHQIKAKTNASILIKRHPDTTKLKICAVEGTQLDIDGALEMIRRKFPLKHYPSVTLEQVCFVPPAPIYPVLPECLQLMLVEGVNNDVILSSLVSPGHFFLQQPTHPTFPALNRLNTCMNVCYSEPNVPLLPTPIDPGVICAAPTMGGWYRAQVVSVEAETNVCEVKFVDYGGYLSLEHTALRQIRSDFMTLPFQASECFLANVVPAGGEEASWSPEAAAVMEELTHGQVLQAQVCDYSEENVPNVFLYAVHCNQVVLVNQELVSRHIAEWWHKEDINDESCT